MINNLAELIFMSYMQDDNNKQKMEDGLLDLYFEYSPD